MKSIFSYFDKILILIFLFLSFIFDTVDRNDKIIGELVR